MTAVLKASDWLNGGVMQLDSHEALCMEYHVCTSIMWLKIRGARLHFPTITTGEWGMSIILMPLQINVSFHGSISFQ